MLFILQIDVKKLITTSRAFELAVAKTDLPLNLLFVFSGFKEGTLKMEYAALWLSE